MTKYFNKVLIANRGEIAIRVLRCLQELNIPCVAIYHAIDKHSPLVCEADEAYEIVGEYPTAAHLDIEQIVAICQRSGVDAVHPCYGFLAENADFSAALADLNICFIGPATDVIQLMGDKIRSREFVIELGFPVAPAVSIEANDEGYTDAVAVMGFPLVVKAAAGGGGKGMNIVHSAEELGDTVKNAAAEAGKYFGDKRVYVERYFESARHIEVQILGDGKRVIHLGERDCTIQRRFQKIIEESPSPVLCEAKRAEICSAAVGIAQAANYSNAGTVEFLYTPEGEFFFLEMNTRIQVEHPVTEMVTGVDIIAEQIKIAAGQPLVLDQSHVEHQGHSIECRICAEDAYNDFLPETGKVLFLRQPLGDGVRVDSGLYENQKVTTAFDPMLAKLVVHAQNREKAIEKAIKALREFVLLGINTNVEYLINVLRHSKFVDGHFDTGFVNEHKNELTPDPISKVQTTTVLAAAMLNDDAMKTLMRLTPEPYLTIGRWRN